MIAPSSAMLHHVPQLSRSQLACSRAYVQLVARRVVSRSQCPASCINSRYNDNQILSSVISSRNYATRAVSRPKAHTGRAKAATPRRAAPKSTEKPAKKTAAKRSKAKPKAKPKKRAAKAKSKPKAKPKKKVLTDEAKARLQKRKEALLVKDLKAKIIKAPTALPSNAWTVLVAEKIVKGHKDLSGLVKSAAAEYKTLSPERREHYNHIAVQNGIANEAAYKSFIQSHSHEEIQASENARRLLARKDVAFGRRKSTTSRSRRLKDSRSIKQPRTSYIIFGAERFASGDLKGMPIPEAAKLISNEWKALSDSEKQPYLTRAEEDKARYAKERQASAAT